MIGVIRMPNFMLNYVGIAILISSLLFVLNLLNRPEKVGYQYGLDQKPLYNLEKVPETVGLYHFPVLVKDKRTLCSNQFGATKIPKTIHFVYGLKEDAIFGLVQYLSIASAYIVHKPSVIYLHCANIPTGFYWDMVSSLVIINIVRDVTKIFGNPVIHYAHKADIIRLRALLKFGGVYLDLDMISLVSFDRHLSNDFVMGREKDVGLCNGVIMSTKHSKFLKIWYNAYKTFNDSDWNYHSVILPNELSKSSLHSNDITILNFKTFFWPKWDKEGLQLMYRSHNYDYKENLAVHLWDSAARKTVTKVRRIAMKNIRKK
jgi:hypothetical protein